jgi:hypothetical protein
LPPRLTWCTPFQTPRLCTSPARPHNPTCTPPTALPGPSPRDCSDRNPAAGLARILHEALDTSSRPLRRIR